MVDYAVRATHTQAAPQRPRGVSFRGKTVLLAAFSCAVFWAGAAALIGAALRL